uniref:Uncharacterized protein n=1 Tax=Oryza nivara TaxID=4536 RepID=A0A0E0J4K7_ORYNI
MARPRRRPRAAAAALGARRCHLLRRPPPPAPLLPPLLLILLVGGGGERRTKPLPAPRRRQKLAVARDRPLRRPPPPLGNWGGELRVCNPATRRRATLPPPPQRACRDDVTAIPVGEYLVFEPAASSPSPHYEVFLIPTVPGHPGPPPTPPAHIRLKPMAAAAAPFCLDERLASLRGASYPTVEEMMEDMAEATVDSPPPSPYEWDQQLFCLMCWQVEYQYLSAEWPPPSYKIDAFSSRTGRWEERVFVREGETATTLEDMKPWNYVYAGPWQGCSVLWQGALYVHSGGACVTRFSLSNDKYQMIRAPINILDNKFDKPYLGKSKMGVSFGFIHDWQLSIRILKESAGLMEWVLTYQHDLQAIANQLDSIDSHIDQINGPWIVEEDDTDIPLNTETLSQRF